jgi:hypothetical protein
MGLLDIFKKSSDFSSGNGAIVPDFKDKAAVRGDQVGAILIAPDAPTVASLQASGVSSQNEMSAPVAGITLPVPGMSDSPNTSPLGSLDVSRPAKNQ